METEGGLGDCTGASCFILFCRLLGCGKFAFDPNPSYKYFIILIFLKVLQIH